MTIQPSEFTGESTARDITLLLDRELWNFTVDLRPRSGQPTQHVLLAVPFSRPVLRLATLGVLPGMRAAMQGMGDAAFRAAVVVEVLDNGLSQVRKWSARSARPPVSGQSEQRELDALADRTDRVFGFRRR